MSTPGTQKFASTILRRLERYTNNALAALDEQPGRALHVAPGESVAWDDCCNGQLWARLVRLQPLLNGQEQAKRPAGHECRTPLFLATVELGIVRCVAVVDDRGRAPKPENIEADGVRGVQDMAALLQAIMCEETTRSIEPWAPRGPQGGCAGGVWQFTMRLSNCVECP